MFKNLNSIDYILLLCNFCFFIIVQTLFFRFVASELVLTIIIDKIKNLKNFRGINALFGSFISNSELETLKEKGESDRKARNSKNNMLIIKSIAPISGFLLLIIIFLILFSYKKGNKWYLYHTKLLFTIVFAFSSELLIFFLLFRKYDFISVFELFYNILVKQQTNNTNEIIDEAINKNIPN